MTESQRQDKLKPLFTRHPRHWRDNLYIYPVISRRSGGLSIGVNLNPDQACNFNCIYCQVDRKVRPAVRQVDVDLLRSELECTVQAAVSGQLFAGPQFGGVPEEYRRINDIAFSGDGEPTISPHFPAAVQVAADVRRALAPDEVKIVLITNAAYLHKSIVKEALMIMDANNGEIWAKLDAGTEDYYRLINRPNLPFKTILDNILEAARCRPIVIQSLWMKVQDQPPPDEEVDAFAGRLRDINNAGGRLRLVQIYTTARQTAEPFVTPLTDKALKTIAERVEAIVDLPITTYGP